MRLLLVDGNYYVYRSFFAIRELTNSRGEPTNAIFGFAKALRRMTRDLAPQFGAVVWDQGLPQRRTSLQPEYKQHRAEMPEAMRPQLAQVRDLAPLFGFASVGLPDTEADDLMASYAVAAAARGMEAILATNDKDLFQVVGPGVRIYSTAKADLAEGKEEFALLGPPEAERKWGVPPDRIGELLSLTGDSVDNIPGVPGIGAKRAARLLLQAGGLDALLEDPARHAGEKAGPQIAAAREQIAQNREMVRLDTDLPLPVEIEALGVRPRYPELLEALERLEFRSLGREMAQEAARAQLLSQGELFA